MLRFDDIRAGYDGIERLHGVSGALPAGRLTAIIGPNGCGKSTLLKCIAGILRPASGDILLGVESLRTMSDRQRARLVSYMPQSRSAPDISVRQLVSHGRYPHLKWGQSMTAADHDTVQRALERTGMDAFAQRPVSRLSGGERQRAYLAMMLAQQTPLMLLDEPTTYLDMSSQFALMALLLELSREGSTPVAVLHDLTLALEYADNLLLMREGRIVARGTPDEVFRSGCIQDVFGVEVDRLSDGRYLFARQSK